MIHLEYITILIIGTILYAKCFTSTGYFLVSDTNYINAASLKAVSSRFISKHPINYGPPNDIAYAEMECIKLCFTTENCRSIGYNPGERMCYLTKMNRCTHLNALLISKPGYNSYDLVKWNSTGPVKSCWSSCMSELGCNRCGRTHCSGEKCTDCIQTCWDIGPLLDRKTTFWVDNYPIDTYCSYEWQQIYVDASIMVWPELLANPVWLRVEVVYSDESKYVSYFDSFDSKRRVVTVGTYVGGDAGNSWNAPFTERELSLVEDTNCLPFYYPSDTSGTCSIASIPTYEQQIANNASKLERKYYWDLCSVDGNLHFVTSIKWFIVPKDKSDIDEDFIKVLPEVNCLPMENMVTT